MGSANSKNRERAGNRKREKEHSLQPSPFPGNSEVAADGKDLLLAVGTNWSRGHAHYRTDDDYLIL